MTLKDLCVSLYGCKKDSDITNCISIYLDKTKGLYPVEILCEEDLPIGIYEKCYVISIYEYLCNWNKISLPKWFNKYKNLICPKEKTLHYKSYKLSPFAPENADKLFEEYMREAIEPFKSHGLPVTEFYYTV